MEHAAEAGIAVNAAKTHLRQLFAKCGCRRQVDLIRLFAADRELLRADSLSGGIDDRSCPELMLWVNCAP
jgi:hypothetical protein